MLSIQYSPGTEPWLPPIEALQRLAPLVTTPTHVGLHHRRDLPAVWRQRHPGRPRPAPYSFRAWAQEDGRIHLFLDATETPASAAWLLLHELAHAAVASQPLLALAYRSLEKPADYLTSDAAHEAWPEERLANTVASSLLPLLGFASADYSRRWWRQRTPAAAQASYAVRLGGWALRAQRMVVAA